MQVVIGITQHPEEAVQKISTTCAEERSTTAVVGPFCSRDVASSWIRFMMGRTADCTRILNSNQPAEDIPWYGVTCDVVEDEKAAQLAEL